MSAEKVCTLSIDHAIRVAKIIATAPTARLPMITQLFHQASVDLEGLEELLETSGLASQSTLIDTREFLEELTAGKELTGRGYLFTTDEFNQYCLSRSIQPRLVKRHLCAAGFLEGTAESDGKLTYSITVWVGGKAERRVAIKPFKRGQADEE